MIVMWKIKSAIPHFTGARNAYDLCAQWWYKTGKENEKQTKSRNCWGKCDQNYVDSRADFDNFFL